MISNCILLIDFLPDLTQTSRLGEIHISLFLAGATSRISLKAQSHAAAEERFRGWGGGGIQTSEPFTGRLAAKGVREKERSEERRKRRCVLECVCVRTCKQECACVVREGKTYNLQHRGYVRGL